jgi:DNA primase
LESAGLNVRVIALPDKADPDDVINQFGAERYKQLMREALPLTAFKLESLKKNYDLTTPDGKSSYAVEAVNIIRRLDNPVEREEYLAVVHKATGYTMQVLYTQADLPAPEAPPAPKHFHTETEAIKNLDSAKEFILSALVLQKAYADLSQDVYSLLEDQDLQRIFCLITQAMKESEYSTASLYTLAEPEDEPLITRLVAYQAIEGDGAEKYQSCVAKLRFSALEKKRLQILENYNHTKDSALLEELKQLQFEMNELKRKKG